MDTSPGAETDLFTAIRNDNVEVVKRLLDSGEATVDQVRNEDEETSALMQAIDARSTRMVELLLQRGADIEKRNADGCTAMHWAACCFSEGCGVISPRGVHPVLGVLLRHGANAEAHSEDGGTTPLMVAVMHENIEAVAALLDHGVDIEDVDEDGSTALHIAMVNDANDVGRMLLARGAAIEARDNNGTTPLGRAASYNRNVDGVNLLLNCGADIEATNDHGATPLFQAVVARVGNEEVVECAMALMAHGAAHMLEIASDGQKWTPMSTAAAMDDPCMVHVFLHCCVNFSFPL